MIIQNGKTFHLCGKDSSYILYINEYGDLLHYYYGTRIADRDYSQYVPFYAVGVREPGEYGLTKVSQEYPAYGHIDMGLPAYTVVNKDGNAISRLRYKSHIIYDGKYTFCGMPSLYAGDSSVQTLEVTLEDAIAGFSVVLYYSVFDDYNVITRCAKITNISPEPLSITRAMSAHLDLPVGNYDTVHFAGWWGRERDLERTSLQKGQIVEMSSARGGSGHQVNPFVMVSTPDANETAGAVYGFSLIYSGDHATLAAMDVNRRVRVSMGINPLNFSWKLAEKESFMTPECVMAYSGAGFEAISHQYHALYRNHLCKSKWAQRPRPVLLNNWEGTSFHFTEEKLLSMAKSAAAVGCELFVLDDGWFGVRDDDTTSLGDWRVNLNKLPEGLGGLAQKINALGLKFGIWMEPEMVSPDSDLYRAHPDWAIAVPRREGAQGRNQLILDLSRAEVRAYVVASIRSVLLSANIAYVKWDMNRDMTDRPVLGYSHRYILGLYQVLEQVTTEFPEVIFEGCAAGGGRFDPGILAYMPQIWTSDNSDAVSRLQIQYSTSFAYPLSAMSAHVTAVPNHQTQRQTSLGLRGAVAMTGSFGYELDITECSPEELDRIREQIVRWKQYEHVMRKGTFYRLQNPFEGEYCAWQTVSDDGSEVIVMAARRFMKPDLLDPRLKLRGLLPEALYEWLETGQTYYGSELMYMGLELPYSRHDFAFFDITLQRK